MLATCQIVICISLLTLVVVPTLEHTYVEFARCIRRLFNTQSSLNIFAQNLPNWQKARNNNRIWSRSNIFRFVPSSSLYLAVQTSQVQKHYAILKKVLGWSHVTHIIFLVLMPSPRSAHTQTRCKDRKCNLILKVSVFRRRGLTGHNGEIS